MRLAKNNMECKSDRSLRLPLLCLRLLFFCIYPLALVSGTDGRGRTDGETACLRRGLVGSGRGKL